MQIIDVDREPDTTLIKCNKKRKVHLEIDEEGYSSESESDAEFDVNAETERTFYYSQSLEYYRGQIRDRPFMLIEQF